MNAQTTRIKVRKSSGTQMGVELNSFVKLSYNFHEFIIVWCLHFENVILFFRQVLNFKSNSSVADVDKSIYFWQFYTSLAKGSSIKRGFNVLFNLVHLMGFHYQRSDSNLPLTVEDERLCWFRSFTYTGEASLCFTCFQL